MICSLILRVCSGPGKPGKSWNFVVSDSFSRTRKSWIKATGPGKFWKSVSHVKNMKCMADSKENEHCNLGSERVKCKF